MIPAADVITSPERFLKSLRLATGNNPKGRRKPLTKRKKILLRLSPRKLSVDTLTRQVSCGLSTLSYLLTEYRIQSVDTLGFMRVVNTSTLYFRGNTKNNFFHAAEALTEAR